jgi:parvulin-like peptidyl-prolyl isomerase
MTDPEPRNLRPLLWLAFGAAAGIALAAWSLLATDRRGLPDGVVASVNGNFIYVDAYGRLVAGLDADTRSEITPELRRRVLDRMIDEELLVQRGLELGLAESDRRVRADITQAMIRSVVLEAEDEPPAEEEVRTFFDEERGFFTQPGRVQVRQVFFRLREPKDEASVLARAEAVRARLLAGDPIEVVREEDGDIEVSPVPDAPLPPTKLREYVGPTALRAVLALDTGAISEPVRSGTGVHVFQIVHREQPSVPPYEQIREQVKAEFVRRAGDKALRRYLDDLRDRAEVEVDEDRA